ncbi:hypothetical protein U0070_008781, partial [Myodes glareolus]
MLRRSKGDSVTQTKSNSSSPKQSSSVQLWDSALYFCALSDTGGRLQGKLHNPRVEEGLREWP